MALSFDIKERQLSTVQLEYMTISYPFQNK